MILFGDHFIEENTPKAFEVTGERYNGERVSGSALNQAIWSSASAFIRIDPPVGNRVLVWEAPRGGEAELMGGFDAPESMMFFENVTIEGDSIPATPPHTVVSITVSYDEVSANIWVPLKVKWPSLPPIGDLPHQNNSYASFTHDNETMTVEERVEDDHFAGVSQEAYFGELVLITDYAYDNNGNLLTKVIHEQNNVVGQRNTEYVFNALNQLISVSQDKLTLANYTYNIEGLRQEKETIGTTLRFYYDGDIIINESMNGTPYASNTYAHKLVMRDVNGTKGYYVNDGHGDVTAVLDESCDVLASYTYTTFGDERTVEGSFDNPYRYTGEYLDEETGLYYLRARYYSPEMHRFISEDSYKGNVRSPLSQNLYIYCLNNPLVYRDPSGHVAVRIAFGKFLLDSLKPSNPLEIFEKTATGLVIIYSVKKSIDQSIEASIKSSIRVL